MAGCECDLSLNAYLVKSKSGHVPVIRVSDSINPPETDPRWDSKPIDVSQFNFDELEPVRPRTTRASSRQRNVSPTERVQSAEEPELGDKAVRPAKTQLRPGQKSGRHAKRGPDGKFLRTHSEGDQA